jgi:succinyl-CoA synthetase alpha subunit
MEFVDVLSLFQEDPETKAIVVVGEIGGTDEESSRIYSRACHKPIVSFIAGKSAPPGKKMGHASAIISEGEALLNQKLRH